MSAVQTVDMACQASPQHDTPCIIRPTTVIYQGEHMPKEEIRAPAFLCPCGAATTTDPPEKHKTDCPARMLTLIRQNKELELRVSEVPAETSHASAEENADRTYFALQAPVEPTQPVAPISSEQTASYSSVNGDSCLKNYMCNICGKQCDSKGYKRHILSHSEDRPFVCAECGDGFAQNSALQRHIMSHTGEKPFTCSVCGEGFKVNYHLKRHYMVHTGLRPFSCQECGEKFSRNSHLKRHSMIHTGEKPFPCSQCGKRFLNSNHLKRHLMTHTGEKPHQCTECGEKFSRGSHLKRHLLSHSGEKPFNCDECSQMFVTLSSLRRHHLTHSGQKPFSCDVCGKRFMDSNHLKRHLSTHEQKPFPLSPEKNHNQEQQSLIPEKKPFLSDLTPDNKPFVSNYFPEDPKMCAPSVERNQECQRS